MITTYQVGASNLINNKPLFQTKNIQISKLQINNSSLVNSTLLNDNAIYDVSENGDTLELSKKGLAKSQSFTSSQMPNEAKNETSNEAPTDLTSYTTYELSQLLAKGIITSAEYYTEIARRDDLKKLNLA